MKELIWIEISKKALTDNVKKIRSLIGKERILCPCVKGNAYGHGLIESAKIFIEAGADWLGVNSLYEARSLREAGLNAPIYVLGYIPFEGLLEALTLDLRMVVYNRETVKKLGEIAEEKGLSAKLHIKIETGNNRQGVFPNELIEFAKYIRGFKNLEIEGASTHFANIEDTTNHSYAEKQLESFKKQIAKLEEEGIKIPIRHCANSAATLLFSKTYFEMVRPGIACFGMWPSNETYLSYKKEIGKDFELSPAMTWKTKIAQIKKVPANEYVGYGCSYKTGHDTKLAILPVGYYDGYDRGINGGYVLIKGKRAPIRGRICMNIMMVEISDIPEAKLEDEVVLIGKDGDEQISAEQFASFAGTINYEVTTRINERIPRIVI